jgi:hypothetical protein
MKSWREVNEIINAGAVALRRRQQIQERLRMRAMWRAAELHDAHVGDREAFLAAHRAAWMLLTTDCMLPDECAVCEAEADAFSASMGIDRDNAREANRGRG